MLSVEKQELVWEAEHYTFLIETYFGKKLVKAMKAKDRDAIENLFAEQVESKTIGISHDTGTHNDYGLLKESKWTADGNLANGALGETVDFIMKMIEPFQKVERAKVRVIKISPMEKKGHWQTELLVAAYGTNSEKKPIRMRSHHEVKFNAEKKSLVRKGNSAYEWIAKDVDQSTSTGKFFEEKTAGSGLEKLEIRDNWKVPHAEISLYHFQYAVDDFNRDGWLDIAVATYKGIPYLLEGGPNFKFRECAELFGIAPWQPGVQNHNCLVLWIDYNNDEYPDLLINRRLYQNFKGIRFKDVTEESGLVFGFDPMGGTVVDYNCDGLLDLYVLYQKKLDQSPKGLAWVGDEQGGTTNVLYRNDGNGKFTDVTVEANAGGGNRSTFANTWFFLDDDHYPDVYIANDFAKNPLLQNNGDGTFNDVTDETRTGDYATSMGIASGDINNDGNNELYVANMFSKMGRRIIGQVTDTDYDDGVYTLIKGSCAGNRLYEMNGDGIKFDDMTLEADVNEVGWAYGPALFDFDADGFLDIYATTGLASFDREKPDG